MKLNNLLAAVALCGSGLAFAGNGNQIDPTASTATQISVAFQFGPTSVIGANACPNPVNYLGVSVCVASKAINLTPGQRFVITNISGSLSFNPNGGSDVVQQGVAMVLNVGNNASSSQISPDYSQVVGTTTYYSFNKSVHMFADPGIGFPEILVGNFQSPIGPFFSTGTGAVSLTFQGYLVPLN
ncbi:MAG TPA: hypothetical protein VEU96_10190 [Bryobacteraceae bacterium]|nr:hypothetical protein [Bryobacteraceae bacterium]